MSKTGVKAKTETKTRTMPLYRVLLHNDDYNTMDHVVITILTVFRFEIEEAVRIMLEAHESGVALCKVEPLEAAEFHCEQLSAAGLTASIESE